MAAPASSALRRSSSSTALREQHRQERRRRLGCRRGAEVYVHHSRFADNSCAEPGHRASAAGGAIHLRNAQVWITDSRFEGNRAGYSGGGLYLVGNWQDPVGTPRALAMIANSTFVANQADNDPGVATVGPPAGGAVHAEDQATVAVYNSRFLKNDADQGGALSFYRSQGVIGNSVLLGNRSLGANLSGGAIRASSEDTPADGAVNRPSARLFVSRSLIAGRYDGVTTVAERGGGIFITGDVNRAWGLGGVSQQGTVAANRANLSIEDSVFLDLDVTRTGGGAGGAIESLNTTLGITGTLFAGCDAFGTNGSGGAVRTLTGSSANIISNTFIGNSAAASGGALYAQGGLLTLTSNQFLRNEVSPGVSETAANSFGAAIYAAQLAPAPYSINENGMVASNLFSENVGLPIYDDDRNGPIINDLRYDGNSFWNDTFGGQIYSNLLTGPKTVAELNSLVVIRSAAGPTDKSPSSNNLALGARPDAGYLRTAPSVLLPTGAAGDDPGAVDAYIAWGWSGSGASLDGASLAPNWGWQTSTTGLHSLSVGGGLAYLARIDDGAVVDAALEFSPPAIGPGGTSTLSWLAGVGSSFRNSSIDQQVFTGGAPSGATEVTPNVTRPYTLLVFAEEGGAVAQGKIYVGEGLELVFADGFESGSTAEWDQTLP